MFGLACSKFGLKISGTCSRRSKFDPPKFEEFEVRLFDVRSKTSINIRLLLPNLGLFFRKVLCGIHSNKGNVIYILL